MRIAIVDPASWSLAYDLPLAESLARAGHEVSLYCTRSPHVGKPTSDVPGVRVVHNAFYRRRLRPLPRRAARALRHPLDLGKLVRFLRDNADVVHVQWMPGRKLDARAWAQLAQVMPVTFTAHNAQEREEAVDPELLRGFTAVIAHSDGGARMLRDAGIGAVWRMSIGAYTQYAETAGPKRLPVSLPDDAPTVVMAGLLRPYKGADVLLEAWPAVRAAIPNAQLVIAGKPMGVELPAAAPEGATLLPRFLTEEELGWLLRRADVCCLPYRRIDMSGVAVSALACGTPLVVSNVGGLGEYVGRGAEIVPPGDPGALADMLIAVLADPGRQDRLEAEARAAVATHYSWDAIAREYTTRDQALVSAFGT